MAISRRPVWAVSTEGVEHDPADARAMTYVTTGGVSGLTATGGGGLTATPGDSTSVRILPCSAIAVSRFPGHVNQSYAFRVDSAVDVKLSPAPSGKARTDAIILRVIDPGVTGGGVPEDTSVIDFWEPVVLQDIPWGATQYTEEGIAAYKKIRYPFVLLGTVKLEAGSSAPSEIVTRATAIGARKDFVQVLTPVNAWSLIGKSESYKPIGPKTLFEVPEWATHARFHATITGALQHAVASSGRISGRSMGKDLEWSSWDMDVSSGLYVRGTLVVVGEVSVAASRRGTTQDFQVVATNNHGGQFGVNSGSNIFLRVDFEERVSLGG